MLTVLLLSAATICACGGGNGSTTTTTPPPTAQQAAKPTIATAPAQNGAMIVTLADGTNGAKIYYTLDGSAPKETSQIYQAPFLVASNLTVNAMAANPPAYADSAVATQAFTPNIGSGTLIWSDEFSASGNSNSQPNANVWTYDVGTNCCGNNELETYCAWGSTAGPCNPSNPNAYLGTDGYLHVMAQNPSAGVYTSARLKSQGLFSFMYGRIEARMKLPESQGMWPAFWLLGNNIATIGWPACGELDIMEHINGSNPAPYVGGPLPGYDWIAGSVHGGTSASEANGTQQYHPNGFSAADWHTYGMIWTKGQIQFYVDSPTNVYATFKSTDSAWTSSPWPFDAGPQFIILNLAVGGDWPGSPDKTTVFPSDMSVDYVRIYSN
ncbi:MAG TPA: family 16 glycosylhydrolase [Terracidiphilus sp.]|nr:family 16 glycosylhydrolase [Terracidiphilus sp.]